MTSPQRLSLALADHYRIERELGAGGMATVYLAHDLKHDRKVALNVVRPELPGVLGEGVDPLIGAKDAGHSGRRRDRTSRLQPTLVAQADDKECVRDR